MKPNVAPFGSINLIVITTVIVALAGCATSQGTGAQYRPIVDLKGLDSGKYEADLRDCQSYAAQVDGAGQQAANVAVAGAVFGALLAAAAGGGYSRNRHAAVGALSGGAAGAAAGERDQRSVIARCLAGRGYSILK
jgi:outer membrane lipoprotein SlyB